MPTINVPNEYIERLETIARKATRNAFPMGTKTATGYGLLLAIETAEEQLKQPRAKTKPWSWNPDKAAASFNKEQRIEDDSKNDRRRIIAAAQPFEI